MKKQFQLSTIVAGIITASVLSSSALAAANYKGEMAPVAAAPCAQGVSLHDGFYIGASAGYDSYRVVETSTSNEPGIFTESASQTSNATGWVGNLHLGYGQYFSDIYYLGVEAFIGKSGADQQDSDTITDNDSPVDTIAITSSFDVGTTYGALIRPGIKINNSSLFYAKLGYTAARFEGKQTVSMNGTSVFSDNESATKGGFAYGLGLESAITDMVSVRTEYTHTNYSSFTNSDGVKFSPSDNQFLLGLSYHFA